MDALARSALLFFAMLFLACLAVRTFSRRQIEFAGEPAVPSMLTSRLGFQTGLVGYGLLLITFYLVVTYYWGPLRQTFGPALISIGWFENLKPILGAEQSNQNEVIPWIVAVVVTFLFTWDIKYNPFVILLEGVLDLLQIPERAVSVFQALKVTKFGRLGSDAAASISGDAQILECKSEYFAADRRDLEYRWAHICYLRYVLIQHLGDARNARYRKFFAKKAVQWSALDKSYQDQAREIGLWMRGPRDYRDAFDLLEKLNRLKDAHYRLLACLAVATSSSANEIWEKISSISHAEVEPLPGNLAHYVVMFPVVLFAMILVGREVSIFAYRHVVELDASLVQFDIDKLKFWVLVSLFIYSAPIAAVLLSRAALTRTFPFGAKRYWGIYGAAFLIGYAIAALTLPYLGGLASFRPFSTEYWRVVYDRELIWPLMPGFVAAFVAFRLDSRASCKDLRARAFKDRALSAAIAAAVSLLVSVLGCLGDTALTQAASFVIVCTTVLVGSAAGWMSRFETS